MKISERHRVLLSALFILFFGLIRVNAENKPERLEWLKDAGFGMFIHWSMDSQLGSVISHSMVGASEDYLQRFIYELPETFNPKNYDPEEWVVLAKLAGMQYMVFTAKHHSGFCMWDTKTTDFNIMNTPYKKDIVAAYVIACRKYDMAVGLYYSPEDFHYMHDNGIKITRRGPGSDPEAYESYKEYIRSQCRELMTQYGPIDVIFFDGKGGNTAREICWELQPDILVTRGAIPTPEQRLPGIPSEDIWETCVTMGTQWQYKPTHDQLKSGTRLIEILIEARAKGGALLLNVGPKPDGTLPEDQEAILREMALWHFVNGESIHDVRPWVVTNEDNIWFTRQAESNTVYGFITGIDNWNRGDRKSFTLKSVKSTSQTTLDVLGQSSEWVEYQPDMDPACRWTQTSQGLQVSMVRAQRLYNNHQWHNPVVFKLSHVEPALLPPLIETGDVIPDKDGSVSIKSNLKDLGEADQVKIGIEYRPYAGFVEELYSTEWMRSEMQLVNAAGSYQVILDSLSRGTIFQYRAIVEHPIITTCGDVKRFSTSP